MPAIVLVSCMSNSKLKGERDLQQQNRRTAKVRFLLPPSEVMYRQHAPIHTNSSTSSSSPTNPNMARRAGPRGPPPVRLLIAQLSSPTLTPRAEFDVAHNISKITSSPAMKSLARCLCLGDIAETSSQLDQNSIALKDIIESAQEQVAKVEKMKKTWHPALPRTVADFSTKDAANKKRSLREALEVFDEFRAEYEKIVKYLDWIEDIKSEKKRLLENQEYMCSHLET